MSATVTGLTFSEEALQSLVPDDQQLVRGHLSSNVNTDGAVQEAYLAAIKQKQKCESKKWQLSFRGRNLVLRDEADKIVRWLECFKSIGDVTANIDPVHIGLPWAAIGFILDIAITESRQMAALLTGMNLVRYMINRLEAYLRYLTSLSYTATTATFEKALIRMYPMVLRFLDGAAGLCQKGSAARLWKALWKESELDEFDAECREWAIQVEIDANNYRESTKEWRDITLAHGLYSIRANVQGIIASQQEAKRNRIIDWLLSPDPYYNHNTACRMREPETGKWLLNSDEYEQWKISENSVLWLAGKAGCGKTFLCSAVIEDIRQQCQRSGGWLAFHYFSFSEQRKQTHAGLLASLIVQLSHIATVFAGAQQLYARIFPKQPSIEALEGVLSSHLQNQRQQDQTTLILDALDELPEGDEGNGRPVVLHWLERITRIASYNLRIFFTSRQLPDIETVITHGLPNARRLVLRPDLANVDIQKYVATEMDRLWKLRSLSSATKDEIKQVFEQKSDGMFRWATCQLHTLKTLKSTEPNYIQEALHRLPRGLDAMYERMLLQIDDTFRDKALAALRWLAFATHPLTLSELAEACLIDFTAEPYVDDNDRWGQIEEILDILDGLVVIDDDETDTDDSLYSSSEDEYSEEGEAETESKSEFESQSDPTGDQTDRIESPALRSFSAKALVRLAHFSVKEYLTSDRITASKVTKFALEDGEHVLAQSCLAYLLYYSRSSSKTRSNSDREKFPFLRYAAEMWMGLISGRDAPQPGHELTLLKSEDHMKDWLMVYDPDIHLLPSFPKEVSTGFGSSLYYASLLGLIHTCRALINQGADVNSKGGCNTFILHAAASTGRQEIVQLLLNNGADLNARDSFTSSVLGLSVYCGYVEIVRMLVDAGADVNDRGAEGDTALELAVFSGETSAEIVNLLLAAGADVNDVGGVRGTALQGAARWGNTAMTRHLLEAGAHVDANAGSFGTALQAAASEGHEEITKLLLEAGANVNVRGGSHGTALQGASFYGHIETAQLLLDHGADVNMQTRVRGGNALHDAICSYRVHSVRILLDAGADIDALGVENQTALQVAMRHNCQDLVDLLISRGAKR